MIGAVVVVILVALALAYIAAPLLAGARRSAPPAPEDEAAARKQAALEALVDLEEERAMGKLSKPDYDELLQRYEVEAVAALRELDAVRVPDREDALEAEIAAARRRLECPHCGQLRPSGAPCPRCGR